ncbi:MAG: glycoside hydrolase [Clostridia bacterium]|nr:glycoside hydrolase [Clostridia bacterium]
MEALKAMTLRQKVGKLFYTRPGALESRFSPSGLEDNSIMGSTEVTDEMRAVYEAYPCGGFTLFIKNIVDPKQFLSFTRDLHSLGDVLLAIGEEGGNISRLANHPAFDVPSYPPMETIARTGDPENAYEAGRTIGAYLREYGLDINYAPVADVNTNPANPIIGSRAFGSDPAVAARFVTRFLDGLHDSHCLGCIKHFPGHGDTDTDTHTGYAETRKTWEELLECEMLPFRAGIAAGADLVMTAHIAAPKITGGDVPSTLSHTLLTEKLRGELGFQGVIITDALEMAAISRKYTSDEAAVLSLEAGADILLMPSDYKAAFDGVVHAVESGRIPEARIEESIARIHRLHERFR